MSSEEFSQLAAKGTRAFLGAYSVIVLQHVLEPQIELRRIAATCKVEAPLFVYNSRQSLRAEQQRVGQRRPGCREAYVRNF